MKRRRQRWFLPCFNLEKSSTPRSTFCLPSPTCLLKNSKSADSVLFCFRDACAVALPHAHLPRACALVRCVPPPCPRSRDQRFVPSARPVSPRGRAPRNGTCDAPRSCSSSPHLRSDGASLLFCLVRGARVSRASRAGFATRAAGGGVPRVAFGSSAVPRVRVREPGTSTTGGRSNTATRARVPLQGQNSRGTGAVGWAFRATYGYFFVGIFL